MKTFKVALLVLFLCAAAYPQTQDLGLGAYANEKGPILLAVDSSMAIQNLKSPYILFIVYMAVKNVDTKSAAVDRNDVTMVYKDQEYKMPTVQEIRKNYAAEIRDIDFYRRLAEAGMISSWIRFYKFPAGADFFPPRGRAGVPVDQGSMSDSIGFRTKCYFKNPGFEKGDKLTIKVRDKKNPDMTGEVEVTLK